MILFDTWDLGEDQPANVDQSAPAINLLELSPEGTIRRYFVDTTFNYPTMAEAYRVAALNGLNRLY